MQILTDDAIVAAGGPPKGRFLLAPELCKIEPVLDAAGEPTGQVLLSAWGLDGCHEWVVVDPPKHDA